MLSPIGDTEFLAELHIARRPGARSEQIGSTPRFLSCIYPRVLLGRWLWRQWLHGAARKRALRSRRGARRFGGVGDAGGARARSLVVARLRHRPTLPFWLGWRGGASAARPSFGQVREATSVIRPELNWTRPRSHSREDSRAATRPATAAS